MENPSFEDAFPIEHGDFPAFHVRFFLGGAVNLGIFWGKRLVILACELDSGKERRFTPETDPELPVRVAVRMSMGVPGLMEPFKYGGAIGMVMLEIF